MAGRHRKPPSRKHRGRHRQPPSNARWIAPTLATLAVLADGGVSAYAALTGDSSPSPPAAVPTALATTSSSPSPTAATPTPTPTHPANALGQPAARHHRPPPKPPALALKVDGHVSWVEVTRPTGHVAFSGLLRHGHELTYRNGPLHVVVGDAGAVRLDRHGHRRSPLGKPGQVVVLNVSR